MTVEQLCRCLRTKGLEETLSKYTQNANIFFTEDDTLIVSPLTEEEYFRNEDYDYSEEEEARGCCSILDKNYFE